MNLPKALLIHVLLLQVITIVSVKAQSKHELSGSLKELTGVPIKQLGVRLIANHDTVTTYSDEKGAFYFSKFTANEVTIVIAGPGYKTVQLDLKLDGSKAAYHIEPIVMVEQEHMLREVVIKTRRIPIVFKQDTTEFNLNAFPGSKDDMLEDAIRRLPGMTIDDAGNVSYLGKPLSMLRVNGSDFFSGNVSDFIKQLPADILSKLQVIDYYGEDANFTGIKTGQPTKMLNLVTNPGMDNGKFGNATTTAGTNKQFGLAGTANYWKGVRQISLGVVTNKTDGISGNVNTNSVTATYRDGFKHNVTLAASYNYTNIESGVGSSSISQSIVNASTLFNETNTSSTAKTGNHSLKINFEQRPNNNTKWSLSPALSFSSAQAGNALESVQAGSINQHLNQTSNIQTVIRSIGVSTSFMHHFVKPGRNITMTYQLDQTENTVQDQLTDLIKYYTILNPASKDSLLNRLLDNRSKVNSYSGKLTYTEPLTLRSSFGWTFDEEQKVQSNDLATEAGTNTGYRLVDSLSNRYETKFTDLSLSLSYSYNNKKLRILAATNVEQSVLLGNNGLHADNGTSAITNRFLSPILNISYLLSNRNTINFAFNSTVSAPLYGQLNPVKNTENIQNVVVGNPNLKPTFSKQFRMDFGHSDDDGGAFNLNAGVSIIKDKVITNNILVPDKLGSLTQETHFLNADGTRSYHAGYFYSFHLFTIGKKKTDLILNGNASLDQNVYYTDNQLSSTQNIVLNQSASLLIKINRLGFGLFSSYMLNSNTVSQGVGIDTKFSSIQTGLHVNYSVTSNLVIDVSNLKTFNAGIAGALTTNPLISNASIKQSLFKKKVGSIQLQAFDLFGHANNLMRSVTANTITDSRVRYISRYLKLTFALRLGAFGKNN